VALLVDAGDVADGDAGAVGAGREATARRKFADAGGTPKKWQTWWSRPDLPDFWPVWKEGSNKPSQEPNGCF
jgi:hypothetical protein